MVRLFSSDRFLLRRDGKTYYLFDTKLKRNVGDGKGNHVMFSCEEDAVAVKNEMVARIAVLSCDANTRSAILSDQVTV